MLKTIVIFCLLAMGVPALAAPRTIGNGGDALEIRFKETALNIRQWIESGNADRIELPAHISLANYKAAMIKSLGNYSIHFTSAAVSVKGVEKTCVNLLKDGKGSIRCNIDRFRGMLKANADDAYRLVHHEFAGLSGFEKSTGSDSDYQISSQLSAFLVDEIIKRLPVTDRKTHEFKCKVAAVGGANNVEIELKPISESETYMLQGTLLNLFVSVYLWETRGGFDLQVSKVPYLFDPSKTYDSGAIADDLTLIFNSGPSFETNQDGSKVGSAYLVHFVEPQVQPPGSQVGVAVTCTY